MDNLLEGSLVRYESVSYFLFITDCAVYIFEAGIPHFLVTVLHHIPHCVVYHLAFVEGSDSDVCELLYFRHGRSFFTEDVCISGRVLLGLEFGVDGEKIKHSHDVHDFINVR